MDGGLNKVTYKHMPKRGHRPKPGQLGLCAKAASRVARQGRHSLRRREPSGATRVPTLCVARVATQRASGCAAQSVSTHLQQRGWGGIGAAVGMGDYRWLQGREG